MQTNILKKKAKATTNTVVPVDLRISARMDQKVHSPFTFVINQSILHNLQYALVWDSLRPMSTESS